MKCEEMTERLTDRLKGLLDAEAGRELRLHLESCRACREEATAIEQLWDRLGEFDEDVPSDRMRARFYAALSAYQEETPGLLRGLSDLFESLWPRRPALQFGVSLAALLLGLFLGGRWVSSSDGEIEALRAEMRSMGQAISVSLLEHQSASERLRGVELSLRAEPDERVVGALLDAVARDSSVNVRLAAVEALSPLIERPRIGRELVEAMELQDSPLMQVALAEVLLASEVEGSETAVERMLESETTDTTVKDYLQDVLRRTG